jgi:hypothetical protein
MLAYKLIGLFREPQPRLMALHCLTQPSGRRRYLHFEFDLT